MRGSQITEDRVPIRPRSAKWGRSEVALARMEAWKAPNAALERLSDGFMAEFEAFGGTWRRLACRILRQARSTFVTRSREPDKDHECELGGLLQNCRSRRYRKRSSFTMKTSSAGTARSDTPEHA